MERQQTLIQASSLIYCVMLVVIFIFVDDPAIYAVGPNMPIHNCWLYQHVHMSWIHLIGNVWVFLYMIFYWHPRWWHLLLAWVVSVVFGILASRSSFITPLVGLSGLIYALMGIFSLSGRTWKDRARFQIIVVITLAIYALFPGFSTACHAYCYLMGLLIAFLNLPF